MSTFLYTANVKLSCDKTNCDTYPGITDLSVASREFLDYGECVASCHQFMDDVKIRVSLSSPKTVFKIGTEINPAFSGTPTISKDWDLNEVARLWIFDEKMEGTGQIHAIGQARVFKALQTESPHRAS